MASTLIAEGFLWPIWFGVQVAEILDDANRERFLTARWNNLLTVSLGIPVLVLAYVGLIAGAISDRTAFIGLVIISSFY